MGKIKKGNIFVYKSKYDSYQYLVTVDKVIETHIIGDTYNAIEYDIISDKGIRFALGELTEVTKVLNESEIAERASYLDKIKKGFHNTNIIH